MVTLWKFGRLTMPLLFLVALCVAYGVFAGKLYYAFASWVVLVAATWLLMTKEEEDDETTD